ncbi:transglutaminase-like cysteine peptidase [Sulfurimonas sp.]|uniref:transglutaminase-like cysteine peptidase n=1 Tax=Sulfurimonas sp. TaxID=2022749 RepID=UPI002626FAC1|nr:transglutaminase-like cysteine peptidase [Sulfurimonas sp.]
MKFLVTIFFLLAVFLNAKLISQDLEQRAQKKYGEFAKNRFISIQKDLLDKYKDADELTKLNAVNTWVNALRYASDRTVYGVADYWATLYEFVGKDKGDCEDYTIAKYYILKEMGVDPHKMKFTYVVYRDRRGALVAHMVLSYLKKPNQKSKSDILILGNNNKRVLPASQRPDLLKMIKMINGDTGPKSKKWKKLEANMKRKKL